MGIRDLGPFSGPILTMADSIADRYGRPRPTTNHEAKELHAWSRIVGTQEELVEFQRRYIGRLEARIQKLERLLARKRFGRVAGTLAIGGTAVARFLCNRWPFSRKG